LIDCTVAAIVTVNLKDDQMRDLAQLLQQLFATAGKVRASCS